VADTPASDESTPLVVHKAILLDTHTLLWLVSAPGEVSAHAREVISDPARNVAVSAVTAWEIAIKTRLGRLDGEPLLSAWPEIIAAMGLSELAIEGGDAIVAGRLRWDHRDPFDRMIVAQAARRGLTIATRDAEILGAALTPTLKV
jgi:PIN domain nuclease of toxin-antitoxin system